MYEHRIHQAVCLVISDSETLAATDDIPTCIAFYECLRLSHCAPTVAKLEKYEDIILFQLKFILRISKIWLCKPDVSGELLNLKLN